MLREPMPFDLFVVTKLKSIVCVCVPVYDKEKQHGDEKQIKNDT